MSNVSANTTMIAARIPKADAAALKIAAPARGLTYTQAVRQAIRDWLSPQIEAPDPVQDAKPVTRRAEGQGKPVGRTGSAHLPTGAILTRAADAQSDEDDEIEERTIEPDPDYVAHENRPTAFDHRPMGLKPVKPKGRKT